jgi:ribonuclease BN (tRNA processing enzyme)
MPFFSRSGIKRGGNTSCVRIDACGHIIVLDCGSGLAQFAADIKNGAPPENIDILLSHLHIDHIIGLPAFAPVFDARSNIRIFTKPRDGRTLAEQVFGIFKPPYFPVDLSKLNRAAMIEINCADGGFMLKDDIKVTAANSRHPDGTTAFRIEAEGRGVIYLLDYEVGETPEDLIENEGLLKFCKGADLIIFDGTYLPEDYPGKRGWGHSHYGAGMKLAELSECKRMIFSHFSFDYTDDMIEAAVCACGLADGGKGEAQEDKFKFAYDGLEIEF